VTENLPVAKIVPLTPAEASLEELELVASGQLKLPEEVMDEEAFWSIGSEAAAGHEALLKASRALSDDREDRDAGCQPGHRTSSR